MDVSIIIVNWNTRGLLAQCLESIAACGCKHSLETIVVDNASADDSVEHVRGHFGWVKLIVNSENLGFAKANNIGYRASTGKYVLYLNSDTIVHPGAIESMTEVLERRHDAGLCSCKLLNADGSLQANVRRFPTWSAMYDRYTIFNYLGLFKGARQQYKMREFWHDQECEAEQVMGAVMMVKRSAHEKIGLMEEGFKFYFEETDLCLRLKTAGYSVVFTPAGNITHLGGASSKTLGYSGTQILYFESMMKFFRKHRGGIGTAVIAAVFKVLAVIYTCSELLINAAGAAAYGLAGKREKAQKKRDKARGYWEFIKKHMVRFVSC